MKPGKLFEEWANLNCVLAPWRARFDSLRFLLDRCTTRMEAEAALRFEGYIERYPLLPDWLP